MEEALLMSDFDRGLSKVGYLSLEDLTTTHQLVGLANQLGLSTTSNSQVVASAIILSLGEGLGCCSIELLVLAIVLHSLGELGLLSNIMGVVTEE